MANGAATTCVSIFHLIGRQAEAKRLLLARPERIVMFRWLSGKKQKITESLVSGHFAASK
jgi:hypothetical protein